MKQRKYDFPTVVPFSVARLKQEAARVQSLGLVQVQFTCETDPGLQAMVYGAGGRIVFYSRYSWFRRPFRVRIGELGLITIDQAKQQHRANRVQAAQGHDPRRPKVVAKTFRKLFNEDYLPQCRARQKKSISTDESRFRIWLEPALGDIPINQITKSDIHNLVLKMIEAEKSPASIRNTVVLAGGVMELGVDLEHIGRNPCKTVRTPRVDNRRTDFLTIPQVKAIMAAAEASEDVVGAGMIRLMGYTNARLGEARAAKWADISLETGVWHLPRQKSGKRGRKFLSEAAKQVIRDLMPFRTNEFLFPGAKGNPQRSRPIKLFRRLCEQAGVPKDKKFRLHDLRHAWISAGVYAGIPLEILSFGANHASPTTTRLYSHAHETSLVAANETIAALITPEAA
jgi:integrase